MPRPTEGGRNAVTDGGSSEAQTREKKVSADILRVRAQCGYELFPGSQEGPVGICDEMRRRPSLMSSKLTVET